MPLQLIIAILVELLLVACSLLLLFQPQGHRGSRSAGWAVLSLTFCWSVILGCMLTLTQYYNGA